MLFTVIRRPTRCQAAGAQQQQGQPRTVISQDWARTYHARGQTDTSLALWPLNPATASCPPMFLDPGNGADNTVHGLALAKQHILG